MSQQPHLIKKSACVAELHWHQLTIGKIRHRPTHHPSVENINKTQSTSQKQAINLVKKPLTQEIDVVRLHLASLWITVLSDVTVSDAPEGQFDYLSLVVKKVRCVKIAHFVTSGWYRLRVLLWWLKFTLLFMNKKRVEPIFKRKEKD